MKLSTALTFQNTFFHMKVYFEDFMCLHFEFFVARKSAKSYYNVGEIIYSSVEGSRQNWLRKLSGSTLKLGDKSTPTQVIPLFFNFFLSFFLWLTLFKQIYVVVIIISCCYTFSGHFATAASFIIGLTWPIWTHLSFGTSASASV